MSHEMLYANVPPEENLGLEWGKQSVQGTAFKEALTVRAVAWGAP